MQETRKKEAGLVIATFIKLLKEYNFGLEIYKDGSLVLTDTKSGGGYKIKPEALQDLYNEED